MLYSVSKERGITANRAEKHLNINIEQRIGTQCFERIDGIRVDTSQVKFLNTQKSLTTTGADLFIPTFIYTILLKYLIPSHVCIK